MKVFFEIGKYSEEWECLIEYRLPDSDYLHVRGVARGSKDYKGNPARLFQRALEYAPKSDYDAQNFSGKAWGNFLQPREFEMLNKTYKVEEFNSSDPLASTFSSLSIRLSWRMDVDKSPSNSMPKGLSWQAANDDALNSKVPEWIEEQANYVISKYHEKSEYLKYMNDTYSAPPKKLDKEALDNAIKQVKALDYKTGGIVTSHKPGKKKGDGGFREVLKELYKHFDMEQVIGKTKYNVTGKPIALRRYVPYLNDSVGLTIEEIADHLESLDINIQMKEAALPQGE